MPRIKIEISEIGFEGMTIDDEAMPETIITLDANDVTSVNKLEGLFKTVALAAGFDYIGRCELRKRVTSLCEGDEVSGYEHHKLEELLKEYKVEDVL